jgi:hypothetical protein
MMPYLHECREKSHGIEQRRNPCTHGALQFFAPIHQLRDPFQRIGEPTVQGSFTRPSNGFPTVQESGTKSGGDEKVVYTKKWCGGDEKSGGDEKVVFVVRQCAWCTSLFYLGKV